MAERKTTDTKVQETKAQETEVQETAYDPDELVWMKLFKDGQRYKHDVDVAVNGRSYRIKRGVRVQVPRCVADVLTQSQAQDAGTDALIEREEEKYNDAVRRYEL